MCAKFTKSLKKLSFLLMGEHRQKSDVLQVAHHCFKALWLVYVPLGLMLKTLYFVHTVYL